MTKQAYNKVAHNGRPVVNGQEVTDVVEGNKPPRLKPVVSQAPTRVKKGLMERMVVGLIGPDGLPRVGRAISREVLGPAVKGMIVDSFINGIQMLVFKDDNIGSRHTGRGVGGPVNYGSHYNGYKGDSYGGRSSSVRKEPVSQAPRDRGQTQSLSEGTILFDWVIDNREEAAKILNGLQDLSYTYDVVKVSDYYDQLGLATVYTDNNFGWNWDDLQRVRIRSARSGFVLDLPPVRVC